MSARCTNEACKTEHFPRTDPAVIMLVHHGDKCLLGRGKQFPKGMHSTLAGFVEPGESLEDAVAREVYEEVKVGWNNVTYRSSQPWPFPASVMIGFHAEAECLDFEVNQDELASALWLSREELRPENLPKDGSFFMPRRDFDRPPADRGMARPRGWPVDQWVEAGSAPLQRRSSLHRNQPMSGTGVPRAPSKEIPMSVLFSPVELGGVTLPNRIVVSPMCQYAADRRQRPALAPRALRHAGDVGRGAAVLRGDACRARRPHHPGLRRPVQRRERGGAEAGGRLGERLDAQRQARHPARPCRPQGLGATAVEGRWAARRKPMRRTCRGRRSRPRRSPTTPGGIRRLRSTTSGSQRVKQAFVDATLRSLRLGFDVIELHGAHGY